MTLDSQEHDYMMKEFERNCRQFFGGDLKREPRELFRNRIFYCDGMVNKLFLAWKLGYSCGRVTYLNQ